MEKSVFGQAGNRVLIEEFLDGEELTIMAFTDGKTVVPMLPAQDQNGSGMVDTGLNTGGMGADSSGASRDIGVRDQVLDEVLTNCGRDGINRFAIPRGLYVGPMVANGMLRYAQPNSNDSMGDPETQSGAALFKSPIFSTSFESAIEHRLDDFELNGIRTRRTCVVIGIGRLPRFSSRRTAARLGLPPVTVSSNSSM